MLKISELKEKRTIHRPTQNFDENGKRIYQEFEYDILFNPKSEKNYNAQLYAKVIDILLYFLILTFIFKQIPFFSFLYSIPIVVFIGAISESLTGQTIGKKIFKLKVIDDFGNYPNLLKSFKRNILCLFVIHPELYELLDEFGNWSIKKKFNKYLNNEYYKTYVVKQKIYLEIKALINKKA